MIHERATALKLSAFIIAFSFSVAVRAARARDCAESETGRPAHRPELREHVTDSLVTRQSFTDCPDAKPSRTRRTPDAVSCI